MKIPVKVRAKDVMIGDVLLLGEMFSLREPVTTRVESISRGKNGNTCFYQRSAWGEEVTMIFHRGFRPDQWLTKIVDADPNPERGLYEI